MNTSSAPGQDESLPFPTKLLIFRAGSKITGPKIVFAGVSQYRSKGVSRIVLMCASVGWVVASAAPFMLARVNGADTSRLAATQTHGKCVEQRV